MVATPNLPDYKQTDGLALLGISFAIMIPMA